MTPVEALRLALKGEEGAIELYKECIAKYPSLADLFSELLTEEQKHKKLIEKRIFEATKY
ncbi:MAG: ferritin-like domain-containing protein [Candidatus Omnitrophica bacterium]|nr:ferritin-like domain-containing protein [Candidatus Omnitrophota bacterium]